MSYITIDLETTTRTLFKRKASPFCKDNWVVMAGWKRAGEGPCSRYFGATRSPDGLLAELLSPSLKVIFGLNLKFDLLHLLYDQPLNYAAWQQWVADGGQIFDGQLAEYLLEGMTQQNHMLSMDEIAPRYGGNVKVDEVKELWAAGVQTEDIDPELLRRYLCGGKDEHGVEQHGDLGNTELICLAQIKRAREAGQLQSLQLNMGSLLASVEMELNGMKVDLPLGLRLAAELQVQIDELHATLGQYLPQDLPFEFKWTSRFHKSALIFGGAVQYEDKEYVHADGSGTLCSVWDSAWKAGGFLVAGPGDDVLHVDEDTGEGITATKALTYPMLDERRPVLGEDGEPVRFKSGKNAGEIKYTTVKVPDLTRPKTRKCKAPYTFPRLTEPKASWESAEPGVYSVSSDVIEELGVRGIPFLTALAKLQAATKDVSTYYMVEDEKTGERKGMLALVGDDGIIHHSINHCSTVTGRFSSSNPNLQNLSKGSKSDVKTVFVSRFEGGSIIQSDFSALEVYVQAILTQCKQLIADLKAGLDMHCKRLAAKEHMSYDEVYALCKGDKYDKEWDYKRTAAKVYSFQR